MLEIWPSVLALIGTIIVALIQARTLIYMRSMEQNTNSKMDKLLKLTDTAAFARGEKAEKDRL